MEVRNLKAYLANVCMTAGEFAEIIDCTPSYVNQLANGTAIPSRRIARDIFKATEGVIKLETNPRKAKKQQKGSEKK
jgi:DNA-binding transcriptional regulator YdaS (Cro superfamily)